MKIFNIVLTAALAGSNLLSAQVEPTAGAWKTWVLSSGSQVRLSSPSSFGAGDNEVAWLKGFMGQADANALAQVAYWDAGPPSYRWMQIAFQEVTKRNIAPTLGTRAMALVAVAMHDATVAAWDTKYTYNRQRPSQLDSSIVPRVAMAASPSFPSEHAVTAAAAAAVLAYLFPDRETVFTSLAEEAARSRLFAGTQFPSDVVAGLQLGRAVASAVIAFAKADGSDAPVTMSYPLSAGVWGNPNPVTPLAGSWRPWVLASGSALRPGSPPAPGSADATDQFADVKNLPRTNATNHSAWFWQPSFITPWLDTVHREIFEHGWNANPPRAARAYALAAVSQHDATIACWDTKYTYLELRPSMADPTITPLFSNPAHPGFPSGHACASGSIAAVLGYLFPADADTMTAQAMDAGLSTFYAGIHTRQDVDTGLALGRAVGQKVVERAASDGAQ
jgi:membrane-associated phospholipid phosphatase